MSLSDINKLTSYNAGENVINGSFPITISGAIGCGTTAKSNNVFVNGRVYDLNIYSEEGIPDAFDTWSLEINVQYSKTRGPCPQRHQCNGALFRLFAEDILLGFVDLNNAIDGGDRNTALVLNVDPNSALYQQIQTAGVLNLRLVCALSWCHSQIPWVTVTDISGGQSLLVYNGCPSTNEFVVPIR